MRSFFRQAGLSGLDGQRYDGVHGSRGNQSVGQRTEHIPGLAPMTLQTILLRPESSDDNATNVVCFKGHIFSGPQFRQGSFLECG
jgi:hypothetical protein